MFTRIIIGLFIFFIVVVCGDAAPAEPVAAPVADVQAQDQPDWQHLQSLLNTIDTAREQLGMLREELRAADAQSERERLTAEIDRHTEDLQSLQTALEMVATGGVDLQLFGVRTQSTFDWREELQSVFEPVLVELKRLTERPRKIERLRSDQAYYQQRLDVAEGALASIVAYRKAAPDAQLQTAFAGLEERWRTRRDNFKSHLDLVNFELQEMFAPSREEKRDPVEALKELLSGRILNLLIAVAAMTGFYLLLRLSARSYNKLVMGKAKRRRAFMARLGSLLFALLTALMVLLSGVVVLYMLGDWLLLGLFIIVLIGAAWAVQRSLPHYLKEAKLMLNLGPVREGERIIYRDLPWLVKSLTFYSTLTNPLLAGGKLHVPLRELVDYQSRQFDADEPWFPSRAADYVILDDGSYGQVVTQTPERVCLRVRGAVKTYPVGSFLQQNPRNLSEQGFTIMLTFGLDYQHQADITGSIRDTFEQELQHAVELSEYKALLTSLNVEFSQAGSSSLDFLVLATFSGAAGDKYFTLQRFVQRAAVDACNKHGWNIPFSQITVHTA